MGKNITQSGTGGIAVIDDDSSAVGSVVCALAWTVARGATNTVIVGSLPANARIIRIDVQVPVVSNAATTATVSVGLNGGSATYFSAAQDVKAAIGNFSQAATANWAISAAKQTVNCTYTETGAASSAGTFYVAVLYCVV
jgi:hypothetical protein